MKHLSLLNSIIYSYCNTEKLNCIECENISDLRIHGNNKAWEPLYSILKLKAFLFWKAEFRSNFFTSCFAKQVLFNPFRAKSQIDSTMSNSIDWIILTAVNSTDSVRKLKKNLINFCSRIHYWDVSEKGSKITKHICLSRPIFKCFPYVWILFFSSITVNVTSSKKLNLNLHPNSKVIFQWKKICIFNCTVWFCFKHFWTSWK